MSEPVAIAVAVGLVLLLMLLGAAESALTTVSRARAEAMRDDEVRGSLELIRLIEDRPRMIAPILAFALAAQLCLASIVALTVNRHWGSSWVPVAVVAEIIVLFVIAEVFPKTWAVRNIDRAAPMAANLARALLAIPPVRWSIGGLMFAVRPLIGSSPRPSGLVGSEEEFFALADAAVASEVIEGTEGEIIQSIVNFGDTIVREAMVPRPDMVSVDVTATVDEAIRELS